MSLSSLFAIGLVVGLLVGALAAMAGRSDVEMWKGFSDDGADRN